MSSFLVTRALPNPKGKDRRPPAGPTNDQLNNEWVEFANVSGSSQSLAGLALSHYTFDARCGKTGEDGIMTFKGELRAGYSIRVHSGSGTVWTEGSVHHLYAGRGNYAWNNVCGDTAVLRQHGSWVDYGSYDPSAPEGVILNREPGSHKLVPASVPVTTGWR